MHQVDSARLTSSGNSYYVNRYNDDSWGNHDAIVFSVALTHCVG
jgi:hypothetical protein